MISGVFGGGREIKGDGPQTVREKQKMIKSSCFGYQNCKILVFKVLFVKSPAPNRNLSSLVLCDHLSIRSSSFNALSPKFISRYASFCDGMFIVLVPLTCKLPIKGSHRNFFSKMDRKTKKFEKR